MFKPHLCCDVVLEKVKFPCFVMPKIDGVRGLNHEGQLYGRSMKRFDNVFTTAYYSKPMYSGFEGEFAAGDETDTDLCRKTTSALTTIKGEPVLTWHIFDICTPTLHNMQYPSRYAMANEYLMISHEQGLLLELKMIPGYVVKNMDELLEWEEIWLEAGYEGMIGRSLDGIYKNGRATAREGAYWRLKRFVQEDAIVLSLEEGQTNGNDAQINELGMTFRSTHQENMIPNGMVGALMCKDVKTGEIIKVGAGKMKHAERFDYFNNPEKIVNKVITYKKFPKGVKDKPRFPIFVSLRADFDLIKD